MQGVWCVETLLRRMSWAGDGARRAAAPRNAADGAPYLRAREVRAIDEVMQENEDVHFLQVVREVERLVRASASMEPECEYVVYEVPHFSSSLTSFTMRYEVLVERVVRHFRAHGFGAYAMRRDGYAMRRDGGAKRDAAAPPMHVWLYVSWCRPAA